MVIEKTDANSFENFIQELNDMNIYDQLLKPIDSSPHENYDVESILALNNEIS